MSSGEDLILTRQDGRPKLMSIEDNTHRYSNAVNAVAVGDVVYISASDTVAKADVDGSGTLPPIGVVQSLDGTDACYVVHSGGIATGLSSLVPGVQYFLSDTAGGMTDSPLAQGKAFLVGVAIKTTDLLVICVPVDLNSITANSQPSLQFVEDGNNRAKIFVNSSKNLEIRQQFTNKHIVFKVLDEGTTREAFRMDGSVPEVVVNQTGDSLVDFRVEGTNETHMLFVDGGNNKVGIGTSQPSHKLDVNGDIRIRGNDIRDNSGNPALTFDGSANVTVVNNISFEDVLMTELSIPGVDVQTDTNAYRFNCPYNLTVGSLALNLDQHTTSGNVTVTVTNTTTSTTMVTLSITGTNLGANTTAVTSGSAAQGDVITFAITATPADAQGLRAILGFRRDL